MAAMGQAHQVTLKWNAPADAIATSTYNVYRANGLCGGNPSFTKIATAVSVLTYTDGTVIPGNYCYYVTQVQNGAESSSSNTVNPAIQPLGVTVSETHN